MKVLVTGAAGFIGSHVADACCARGDEVVGVDDLSGGSMSNVPEGVVFENLDVTDAAGVADLFVRHQFDTVYHLAAYAAEGLSHFIRRFNYRNNVIGSMTLVNESIKHDVGCFVFTSSIAVYGTNRLPMTEDLVPNPEDPYGIGKYAVELDLAAAHAMFGLNYVIFRPHNVYGERQNIADRYRNVIGIFMNRIMCGEPMTIFGDGEQTRAFTHVSEVAPLIAGAPAIEGARNAVFNLGSDTHYSVNALADLVAESMGVEPLVEHLPARNEVAHAYCSHATLHQVFGKTDAVPFRDGLKRMADWALGQGGHEPVRFRGIEVTKGLPPSWRTDD